MRSLFNGFSWAILRGLGNSGLARLSILAPIFGHLILFNEPISRFLASFDVALGKPAEAPLSILYFLYLGLFFMGLASAVYQIRCHRVVKRYFDEEDFVLSAGPSVTRRDLQIYLEVIEEAHNSEVPSFDPRLARQQFEKRGGALESQGDTPLRNDIMKAYYAVLARARPFSRAITAAFYLVAFGCLAVPSVKTFLRVIVLLVGSLVG